MCLGDQAGLTQSSLCRSPHLSGGRVAVRLRASDRKQASLSEYPNRPARILSALAPARVFWRPAGAVDCRPFRSGLVTGDARAAGRRRGSRSGSGEQRRDTDGFRWRARGKRFNGRRAGLLNRTHYPTGATAFALVGTTVCVSTLRPLEDSHAIQKNSGSFRREGIHDQALRRC